MVSTSSSSTFNGIEVDEKELELVAEALIYLQLGAPSPEFCRLQRDAGQRRSHRVKGVKPTVSDAVLQAALWGLGIVVPFETSS